MEAAKQTGVNSSPCSVVTTSNHIATIMRITNLDTAGSIIIEKQEAAKYRGPEPSAEWKAASNNATQFRIEGCGPQHEAYQRAMRMFKNNHVVDLTTWRKIERGRKLITELYDIMVYQKSVDTLQIEWFIMEKLLLISQKKNLYI